MSKAVTITREEHTSAELRRLAARTKDAAQARRALSVALVMEGASRAEAARAAGMDRQTLRDWVHRYNEGGFAGLISRQAPGRAPKLTSEQMAKLAEIVETGPDPETDGIVRWRRVDLCAEIARRFEVELHERTVGKLLARLAYSHISARPKHPKGDPEAQEAFKKNFAERVAAALPESAAGKAIEVWFQDEARVGQKGNLTRVWAKRGSRPRAPRDNRYKWAYLFGAVCPQRGVGAGLVLPSANAEMTDLHLAQISRTVRPGAHAVVVLDGAGFHKPQALEVPDNITLLHLPPYSPELNPVEKVWQYLRQNWLAHTVFPNQSAILDACADAWNRFVTNPANITSITERPWATVNYCL